MSDLLRTTEEHKVKTYDDLGDVLVVEANRVPSGDDVIHDDTPCNDRPVTRWYTL